MKSKRPHLPTLAACILATLAINALPGFADNPQPLPRSAGPSTLDKLNAMQRRLDDLQIREAVDRRNIKINHSNLIEIARATNDALDGLDCLTGAEWVVVTDGVITASEQADPLAMPLVVLDRDCA